MLLFNQLKYKDNLFRKLSGEKKKEKPQIRKPEAWNFGGVDGTRTRDPRRDRPVF